jgi:hypothetical protein
MAGAHITLVALLCAVLLGAEPAVARSPVPLAQQSTLSVEELVTRLAAYALTPADVPAGVRLAGTSVDTPATLAPLSTPPGGVPARPSPSWRGTLSCASPRRPR